MLGHDVAIWRDRIHVPSVWALTRTASGSRIDTLHPPGFSTSRLIKNHSSYLLINYNKQILIMEEGVAGAQRDLEGVPEGSLLRRASDISPITARI